MSQALVITGMHRSGTSLVSSVLQLAGLDVGRDLLGGNSANPHGYFEDVEFFDFHEGLLHARHQAYLHLDDAFRCEPTEDERTRARALVASRSHLPLWGWKDPRTCLFLGLWSEILPTAKWLFLYRDPLAVLVSLVRRGEFDSNPNPEAGLVAWRQYNERLLAFYRERPGDCVLASVDAVTADADRFGALLRTKLGLGLHVDARTLARVYHPAELRADVLPREAGPILEAIDAPSRRLLTELHAAADMPAPAAKPAPSRRPLPLAARVAEPEAGPPSPAVRRALVMMLLEGLAPDETAQMLERSATALGALQQTISYVWREVQRLKCLTDRQAASLAEPEARVRRVLTRAFRLRARARVALAQSVERADTAVALAEELRTTADRLRVELSDCAAAADALTANLRATIDRHRVELAEGRSAVAGLTARVASLESELAAGRSSAARLATQLEATRKEATELRAGSEHRRREIDRQRGLLAERDRRCDELRQRLEAQSTRAEARARRVHELRRELAALNSRIQQLEDASGRVSLLSAWRTVRGRRSTLPPTKKDPHGSDHRAA